jgi:hypothetical protein
MIRVVVELSFRFELCEKNIDDPHKRRGLSDLEEVPIAKVICI